MSAPSKAVPAPSIVRFGPAESNTAVYTLAFGSMAIMNSSVISAMAAGQAAGLLGQKVDGLGRPGGTRDGEVGGDAVRVEHDAVGLQSGCQGGIDFFDVDLLGNEIVHAYVVSIRRPGGCVCLG